MPALYSWQAFQQNAGGALPSANIFPLALDASGRFLKQANGNPFLCIGDSPYSIEVQLTNAQIDTYLNDRQAKGFTAILFECMEHLYSSQTPAYQNANGQNPFSSMTDFSTANPTYFNTVDYIVNGAKARGMACFITPAYLGFGGGSEGWTSEVNADTTGHLQTYGSFLANRYTQGNVIWVMGGDYAGDSTLRARQWNIVTGMRTVRTTDIICGHPQRGQDAYGLWGPGGDNLPGWNFGTTYCAADGSDAYSLAATAYGRSGPIPFVQIENGYEGERTLLEMRRSLYGSLLSGACGTFYGNNPVWGFGEPNHNGGTGAAAVIASGLTTTGTAQVGYLSALMASYAWWLLVPKTDTSLVSTSLGTGTGHVCPAVSSDGTFAFIYSPSVNVTVVMTAFSKSSMRVRSMDPTTGAFTALGSFANTGTQSFTVSAESVLVFD